MHTLPFPLSYLATEIRSRRDVKKCPRCHELENEVRQLKNKAWQAENNFLECSDILQRERIERGERDAFGDYEELANRFASVYRDMDSGAEIRARINLLPMQAKMAEVEARTASYKARKELTEAQKKMTEAKTEKIALENEEKRAMIQLYQAAQQAVERIGAGQAIEADFEVIDNLKQIGVKFTPKIKSAALLKQTNGEGVENAE